MGVPFLYSKTSPSHLARFVLLAQDIAMLRLSKGLIAMVAFAWLRLTVQGETIDFDQTVAPLLTRQCLECHNDRDRKGGLDLSSREGLLSGGKHGAVVDSKRPLESTLLAKVAAGEMPPKDRGRSRALPAESITVIRSWIQGGAPFPHDKQLNLFDTTTEHRAGRDWWALQPVERPDVPIEGFRNPIDAFVEKQRRVRNLETAPPASRRQVLRRASYDLTGLPPSRKTIEEFESDPSPDAFERQIDRLLNSPHYGERWARHWLDVVRFAETDGYERDRLKPNAWRYRDWVINALNQDMPYTQFVTEQLAGDEIDKPSEQSLIATGMLRMGTWNDEPNDPADYLYERLEDMVHTTSSAFLGLTIKCARCHDHKFDPILQKDYYRVASYFWAGYIGQGNQGGPSADQLGRPDIYGWTDRSREVDPIRLLINGERNNPGPIVEPGFPSSIPYLQREFQGPPESSKTTQRRLQFAKWICDKRNPLAARVLVNRLWQHHFGTGLISTPNNFGFKSDPPSHPQLLDWLAAEFVQPSIGAGQPWTLKRIHKLVMLSDTYQQASVHPKETAYREHEAANRFLWKYPRRRLDAEALRDSMLLASGQLNDAMRGPSFFPRMSPEALEGLSRKDAAWQESAPNDRARRSIYMMTQRSRLLPLMTAFDFTETTSTCAQRDVTTVAPQALALLNNEFGHRMSAAMADRIQENRPIEQSTQIDLAWELAFQRGPTGLEQSQALDYLRDQATHFQTEDNAAHLALTSLCHVLLNTNEFIYVD